jgi:5-methylcytosine-specific restriction protein A
LAEIKAQYKVNPTEDLKPVCPNCHAMIHKNDPPFSIEELQKIMQKNT